MSRSKRRILVIACAVVVLGAFGLAAFWPSGDEAGEVVVGRADELAISLNDDPVQFREANPGVDDDFYLVAVEEELRDVFSELEPYNQSGAAAAGFLAVSARGPGGPVQRCEFSDGFRLLENRYDRYGMLLSGTAESSLATLPIEIDDEGVVTVDPGGQRWAWPTSDVAPPERGPC